jgi:ribose/xylose/arabinose/galactoside ABC-type transport system permease subunit
MEKFASRLKLSIFKNSRKKLISYINVFAILAVIYLGASIFIRNFLTLQNIDNILRQGAITTILATGMTFLIISGNFDLSLEGQVAAISMIIGFLIDQYDMHFAYGFILAPFIGTCFGVFNGYLSTKIPSFIVTLGMLTITRGIALLITGARSIAFFPDKFLAISRITVINIPILIIYTIVVVTIGVFISRSTPFGRQVFAIGGNRIAARSSGIPVNKNIIIIFLFNGILCGFCALLVMARLNSAYPLALEGESLNIITAVIIGGTSLWGGSGTVLGTVAGSFLITTVSNIFNLVGVSSAWKRVILGFILIFVIFLEYIKSRGK